MIRPLQLIRLVGVCTLIAVLGVLLTPPPRAGAQTDNRPSLAIAIAEAGIDGTPGTAVVGLDPGTSSVGALSADLTYDATRVEVLSCEISEAGACNDLGGVVKFAVFRVGRIAATEQLVTISFVPVAGARGQATFTLDVTTAADTKGADLGTIIVEPATIDIAQGLRQDQLGSLTGDVVNATSSAGFFGARVCAVSLRSRARPTDTATSPEPICVTSNGWGAWRIDGLRPGEYSITISDPYDDAVSVTLVATARAGTITTGLDVVLTPGEVPGEAPTEPKIVPIEGAPKPVVYGASIAGTIRGMSDGRGLQAIQVCATQPLVLHQSCGSTNNAGEFFLDGVSSGNYWITAVDPLVRFTQARPVLVGVSGDEAVRSGVTVWLVDN